MAAGKPNPVASKRPFHEQRCDIDILSQKALAKYAS
jgi:hypothetical protein